MILFLFYVKALTFFVISSKLLLNFMSCLLWSFVVSSFFFLNSCCNPLNNYMVFNDTDGLYTYTFEAEKKVNNNNNYY